MKKFKIFRPGKHTAACGTVINFTEDDLKRAVLAYKPEVYAAPLVIGHPKQEDRAYGWTESLTYEDGHVVAHPAHVEPNFAELVETKAFRNRSASWYMPDHPSNPVPGVLYPKHIGFLGAVPPALKGLGDIQFSETAAPVDFSADPRPDLVLEFDEFTTEDRWSLANTLDSFARQMRAFRDALIGEKGLEEADKQMPDWQIRDAEREAMRMSERAREESKKNTALTPAYTEVAPAATTTEEASTMTPEEIAAIQAENERLKSQAAQFAERDANLKKAERLAKENAALDVHVKAGRILPAQRAGLAAFMATLNDTDQVVEFGEAVDGATPTVSQHAAMQQLLASMPKQVEYREVAGNPKGEGGPAVVLTPRQLADKIQAKVADSEKSGRTLSYSEASRAVCAEFDIVSGDTADTTNV